MNGQNRNNTQNKKESAQIVVNIQSGTQGGKKQTGFDWGLLNPEPYTQHLRVHHINVQRGCVQNWRHSSQQGAGAIHPKALPPWRALPGSAKEHSH